MTQDQSAGGLREALGSGGDDIEAGLARQLGQLARELQAAPDMVALLQRITDTAVVELEGAACVHQPL